MTVALLLLVALVATPLYLWRRPRAESIAAASAAVEGGASPESIETSPIAAAATPPAEEGRPTLAGAQTLSCQDAGSKKSTSEQCDRLVEVEKALAKAIEESSSCVPKDAGGGTVQFVADVSFTRKVVNVTAPKDTRTMKNAKFVAACQSAVKARLQSLSLDAIPHTRARYHIAITVTYAGAVR